MQNYQNLEVWKESLNLTISIYKLTEYFPKSEIFGITSQLRRASSSIMSNIAEGAARRTNPDFHKFLNISYASAAEVESFLILSKELNYIQENDFSLIQDKLDKVKAMIFNLKQKLKY